MTALNGNIRSSKWVLYSSTFLSLAHIKTSNNYFAYKCIVWNVIYCMKLYTLTWNNAKKRFVLPGSDLVCFFFHLLTCALEDGGTAKQRYFVKRFPKCISGYYLYKILELIIFFQCSELSSDGCFVSFWLPTSQKAWSSKHLLSCGGLQNFHLSSTPLNGDIDVIRKTS